MLRSVRLDQQEEEGRGKQASWEIKGSMGEDTQHSPVNSMRGLGPWGAEAKVKQLMGLEPESPGHLTALESQVVLEEGLWEQ
jgi:hypothetical protein